MPPTVDVLMACYNGETYVERAITSVLTQQTTFGLRLIVVDDCSTDDSPKILKKLASLHENLLVEISPINRGGTITFCTMLSKVNADYVMFLDADDRWYSRTVVENLISHLEATGDAAVTSHNITEGSLVPKSLKQRQITLRKFAAGYRFPMGGTAMRMTEELARQWRNSIPGVTKHQSDLTICLSAIAPKPLVQLPIVTLVYNARTTNTDSNYNSITSESDRILDRLRIVRANLEFYWNRPSYYIFFVRIIARLLLLPLYKASSILRNITYIRR